MKIYSTAPAPLPMAGWLQSLLVPLAQACRIQRPPPLEIRCTGQWGGWCESQISAPDGRVIASNKIVFWTADKIRDLYIHEISHRLLDQQKIEDHGPEFLCLNMILLLRTGHVFEGPTPPIFSISLYDFQDQPEKLDDHEWPGIVLNWALKNAKTLAKSEISAEALPGHVCVLWSEFLEGREIARRDTQNHRQQAAIAASRAAASATARLRGSRELGWMLAAAGWLLFALTLFLLIKNS